MNATTRVARFLQDREGGIGGQSEHRLVLGDSGDGCGGDGLALFSSMSEALSFSFSLLKPHGELTLGHLEVLDVGGGAIEKRDLAEFLVGDGKRVLEAAVTLPEFVAPTLFGLDSLTADLLPAPGRTSLVGGGVMGWRSSSSSESEDLDFLVRSLVTREEG